MDTAYLRHQMLFDMPDFVFSVYSRWVVYSRRAERDSSVRKPSSNGPIVYIPNYIDDRSSDCIKAMCDILQLKYEKCECIGSVLW
jgi:hypothetical protein